jgi:hypothetical protein
MGYIQIMMIPIARECLIIPLLITDGRNILLLKYQLCLTVEVLTQTGLEDRAQTPFLYHHTHLSAL